MAASAVLVLSTALTACGSDGDDDAKDDTSASDAASYCDQVKDAGDGLENLTPVGLDSDEFDEVSTTFDDLVEAAPSEAKADWETLSSALDAYKSVLDELGFSLDEVAAAIDDETEAPEGFDAEAVQQLQEKLSAAADEGGYEDAYDALVVNVQDECDFDLSGAADEPDTGSGSSSESESGN